MRDLGNRSICGLSVCFRAILSRCWDCRTARSRTITLHWSNVRTSVSHARDPLDIQRLSGTNDHVWAHVQCPRMAKRNFKLSRPHVVHRVEDITAPQDRRHYEVHIVGAFKRVSHLTIFADVPPSPLLDPCYPPPAKMLFNFDKLVSMATLVTVLSTLSTYPAATSASPTLLVPRAQCSATLSTATVSLS